MKGFKGTPGRGKSKITVIFMTLTQCAELLGMFAHPQVGLIMVSIAVLWQWQMHN